MDCGRGTLRISCKTNFLIMVIYLSIFISLNSVAVGLYKKCRSKNSERASYSFWKRFQGTLFNRFPVFHNSQGLAEMFACYSMFIRNVWRQISIASFHYPLIPVLLRSRYGHDALDHQLRDLPTVGPKCRELSRHFIQLGLQPARINDVPQSHRGYNKRGTF